MGMCVPIPRPSRPSLGVLGLAVLTLLLTGGCRDQEQDRVLLYDKGTYLGDKSKPLDAEVRAQLSERIRTQQARFERTAVPAAPPGSGAVDATGVRATASGLPNRAPGRVASSSQGLLGTATPPKAGAAKPSLIPDEVRDAARVRTRMQSF